MNNTPPIIYEGHGRDRTVRLAPGADISMRALEERATPWRLAFNALLDLIPREDTALRESAEEALYRAAAEIARLRAVHRLAAKVRDCQRAYFRNSTRASLATSKRAEKELDDLLAGQMLL